MSSLEGQSTENESSKHVGLEMPNGSTAGVVTQVSPSDYKASKGIPEEGVNPARFQVIR